MFLVEGLYRRIELLSEKLHIDEELLDQECLKLSIEIDECKKFKEDFKKYKQDIKSLDKNKQSLDEYLKFVDRDLSLDLKTAKQKIKVDSIRNEIDLIKGDIISSVNNILENSSEFDYNNINKKICNSITNETAKNTVNGVFLQKKIEKQK